MNKYLLFTCFLFSGCQGTYFNYASVYFGAELDKDTYCAPTRERYVNSNMGAKLNIFESLDKKKKINAKYSHHSCVFGDDKRGGYPNGTYDAIGIEGEYFFFNRKVAG